jgi:WD40 repeat protein
LRKELLEIRQFIENSWRNYEKRQLLLSAEDLKYIAPYEDKLFLNEKMMRFIAQSKRSISRARRRRQNVLLATGIIIITILSFFTIWALRERSNALEQKKFAEKQTSAALNAKNVADSAMQQAVASKNLAIENEKIALVARKQSDEARKEALSEREYALLQKQRAEEFSLAANEQAIMANTEKSKAEQERLKAVAAETKARQLGALSLAQNYALTSMNQEESPIIMGRIALMAFSTNKNNGGNPDDPVIFSALTEAWMVLDSTRHSKFSGSENEIWSICHNGDLITADLDGFIKKWNFEGDITGHTSLDFISPLNFIRINPSGKNIITQHDNFDIRLWRLNPTRETITENRILTDNSGFIQSADFSEDGSLLATCGNDSLIIIWDLNSTIPSRVNIIKTTSSVISVIFSHNDTIFYTCTDGTVNLRYLEGNDSRIVYSAKDSKPLSLAWNKKENSLITGFSNGSLLVFYKRNNFGEPLKFTVHDAGIDMMAFNSDFSLFATSSRDRTINLYFYDEFFVRLDEVVGVVHIKELNSRIRSLTFTRDNKLAAGLSDKTIRIWETSSEKLAAKINDILQRDYPLTEKR